MKHIKNVKGGGSSMKYREYKLTVMVVAEGYNHFGMPKDEFARMIEENFTEKHPAIIYIYQASGSIQPYRYFIDSKAHIIVHEEP